MVGDMAGGRTWDKDSASGVGKPKEKKREITMCTEEIGGHESWGAPCVANGARRCPDCHCDVLEEYRVYGYLKTELVP